MQTNVSPTSSRRNTSRFTRRDLALMEEASSALLHRRAPRLTIDELEQAERLFDELDRIEDSEPDHDERYDMARDLAADGRRR